MDAWIEGYRCITPMRTAGSGSARWCIAVRGMNRYFLKEFLNPVYPVRTDTVIGQRQLERCLRFEDGKQRLYRAASCVIGDVLVPVVDFFRANRHYYAVSEAAPEGFLTAGEAAGLSAEEKRRLLHALAVCLQRLHAQGIVHADLKPEHVLLTRRAENWQVQLIDLDSGFLTENPPPAGKDMEGDPAYLAPEAFLHITGADAPLGIALDTFAFGAMIHQIWTGNLPDFDRERYHYLYEAALDDGRITLNLPEGWEPAVRRMLAADPFQRPSDAEIAALFAVKPNSADGVFVRNSLSRFMKV